MNKDTSNSGFPVHLFHFSVASGWSLSWQLRAQGGTPAWTGHPSAERNTHTTLTQPGTVYTGRFPSFAHLWNVEGLWSSCRKPIKTCEECANCTQTMAPAEKSIFFSLQ